MSRDGLQSFLLVQVKANSTFRIIALNKAQSTPLWFTTIVRLKHTSHWCSRFLASNLFWLQGIHRMTVLPKYQERLFRWTCRETRNKKQCSWEKGRFHCVSDWWIEGQLIYIPVYFLNVGHLLSRFSDKKKKRRTGMEKPRFSTSDTPRTTMHAPTHVVGADFDYRSHHLFPFTEVRSESIRSR